jgi:hypothetical protein
MMLLLQVFVEAPVSTSPTIQPFLEKTTNEIAADLLDRAMLAFGNMAARNSCGDITGNTLQKMLKVVTQLSKFGGFEKNFLKPNNLAWLNALKWENIKGDLGFASNTPMGALNSWLAITDDVSNIITLAHHQVRTIFSSGVLKSSQDRGPDQMT